MKIGWVGLGRLGLPCAAVLADSGHQVYGYDVDPSVRAALRGSAGSRLSYLEPGVAELLQRGEDGGEPLDLSIVDTAAALVAHSEVVFVAVQTPHAPEYGGETPAPAQLRDFEYAYLVQAVREVAHNAAVHRRHIVIVVVSTVLPGTTDRLLRPLLNDYTLLVYSPQFVAMGTAIRDFRNPEFLLLGCDHTGPLDAQTLWPEAIAQVRQVFERVHTASLLVCSIVDAEMTKVAYNTFISLKITWANHLGALCEAVGADADTVIQNLATARGRVVSTAYLQPGMGDGGACHPRDLIAMGWLEERVGVDQFFGSLAVLRERQTERLARFVLDWAKRTGLSVVVLGQSYKPGTPLRDGSPAILLAHYLHECRPDGLEVHAHDPAMIHAEEKMLDALGEGPAVFVVATNHPGYHVLDFPAGSVVIDPWGDVPASVAPEGVLLIRPGRR